jgi:6-pyruvoyl-tetrahydropterin synthase
LKDLVNPILDKGYDHRFLINTQDPRAKTLREIDSTVICVPYNPTAENLAFAIWKELQLLQDDRFQIGVRLWETENSYAEV